MATTSILAGIPAKNPTLYHRIRFLAPDSTVWIGHADGSSTLIVRDIEMDRARQLKHIERVACSADFTPEGGLSADRDTALAQAAAECLRQSGETQVTVEGSLPYLYAHHLQEAGITLEFSADFGVMERRTKDEQEIEWLRHAQKVTGEAITHACRLIANASADREGILQHDGAPLTSERTRSLITAFLAERNFSNHHDSIVVTLPHVADCHHFGEGALRTEAPIIVDIFPMDNATRYHGDMTRAVVHGEPSDEVKRMHAAVAAAKQVGCEALEAGTTGDAVHKKVVASLEAHGYSEKLGPDVEDRTTPYLRHGTGHGIGLEVHEPILLAPGGGEILAGEIFTVEPGLYSSVHGGVRIEDMVLATADGHEILSPLHEGLDWKD
ncbi:MAG: Xaa-Pro peptidase family protein [Akkermansiaceae bacterium]|nr:Xaa-Pro peptidase family protein [Akkermansiaceae bacterium]